MTAMDDAAPEPGSELVHVRRRDPLLPARLVRPIDLTLGAVSVLAAPLAQAGAEAVHMLGPVVGVATDVVLHPPLVPDRWAPAAVLDALERRGRALRAKVERVAGPRIDGVADAAVPAVLDLVLDRTDLTAIVRRRVDLGVVVAAALDTMDLTEVVRERVDLGVVVTAALDTMDLTEVVRERVDLGAIVTAALDTMDLTAIVKERVDLGVVVTAALDTMDLTAIVHERVDLAGLADEVIKEVDLPEIIRESSSGVATDVVNSTRLGAIDVDDRIARVVDRIMLRRRSRDLQAPGEAAGPAGRGES
jgi:hypothetical protein